MTRGQHQLRCCTFCLAGPPLPRFHLLLQNACSVPGTSQDHDAAHALDWSGKAGRVHHWGGVWGEYGAHAGWRVTLQIVSRSLVRMLTSCKEGGAGFESRNYDCCAIPGRKPCQGQLAKTASTHKMSLDPQGPQGNLALAPCHGGTRSRSCIRQGPWALLSHPQVCLCTPSLALGSAKEKPWNDLHGNRIFQGGLRM